jgi:hypothetical protein
VLCGIEDAFAPSTVGESPEWAAVVNSAEENTATFCKAINGKPLFCVLHGIYTVSLSKIKTTLKKTAPGQRKETTNTAGPSSPQDDGFQEVRRRKRQSTGETERMNKKPVPATLAPKEVPTQNFFATLLTTNMETESSRAEVSSEEDVALQNTGRPPPIILTTTTNLIHLQRHLKNMTKDDFEFVAPETEPESLQRAWRTSKKSSPTFPTTTSLITPSTPSS